MKLESRFFDLERRGAVIHLRMARADKANSMNGDFWRELPRLLAQFDADPGSLLATRVADPTSGNTGVGATGGFGLLAG